MAEDVNVILDTEKMRIVAKTLENQISVIRNCYGSIAGDALCLKGTHWEGKSADAYHDSMKCLCNEEQVTGKVSAGSIVGVLQGYVHDLNFAADEYDRNEGQITNKIEALPTSVFGI